MKFSARKISPRIIQLVNLATIGTLIGYSIFMFRKPVDGHLLYLMVLSGLPVAIFSLLLSGRLTINRYYISIILGLFAINTVNILTGYNSVASFAKIASSLLVIATFYYFALAVNGFSTKRLFSMYLSLAVVLAGVGIIQYVSYTLRFRPGYDYSWFFNNWKVVGPPDRHIRVNSIFPEPAMYCMFLAPASFVAIARMAGFSKERISLLSAIVIVIAVIISTSSLGFISLFIGVLLVIINMRKFSILLVGGIIGVGGVGAAYNFDEGFKLRADSAMAAVLEGNLKAESSDMSTFTLLNNAWIAYNVAKNRPLIGGGLGSHASSFERYSLSGQEGFFSEGLNKQDGNSLLVRIVSESGIPAAILVLLFLFSKYLMKSGGGKRDDWVVQNAILVYLIVVLFRNGHYFVCGTPLWMFMYYYHYKEAKSARLADAQVPTTSL